MIHSAARAGPAPERLAELSELDVRTVMKMVREEFTVDDDRTYLMGRSRAMPPARVRAAGSSTAFTIVPV